MAPNGDYVVVWEDDQDSDGFCEIGARGFLANEQQRFGQMCVNTTTTGQQRRPDVAMDDSGRFVVVWEDDGDGNGVYQIEGRGFGAAGTELIAQMPVNLLSGGNQVNPAVAMDSAGNWFAVWEDNRTGDGYQIVSQEFTISGGRVFADDVQVNTVSTVTYNSGSPRRQDPALSVHKSGRYVVAWADDMDGNGFLEILARGVTGTARSLVMKSVNGSVGRSPSDVFYKRNASVVLSASPLSGYRFVRWEGDVPAGQEGSNPLTITMNSNKKLTAGVEPTGSGISDWSLYGGSTR